jgi:hypothetical protein
MPFWFHPQVAAFDKLANRHALESVSQRLIITKGAKHESIKGKKRKSDLGIALCARNACTGTGWGY